MGARKDSSNRMRGRARVTSFILWGATGQAKVLRECMKTSGLELLALFDNDNRVRSPFPGMGVVIGRSGFERWIRNRSSRTIGFLVAIGGDKGAERVELQEYLASFGLAPLRAQHPTAFVADDADLGHGTQILAHASVCVEASLGRACIVNTGASVDHECRLGDGVHVCPGARLAGCVSVGDYATIGTGAVVLPRLSIGERAVVGAGAVVVDDVAPGAVVAGNPARLLRKRGHERLSR